MVAPKDERYLAGLSMNAFIATALDPHTYIVPKASYNKQVSESQKSLVGIGVRIESHPLGALVTFVLKDGPAEASGLQPGDVLTALDEKTLEGLSPQDVSDLIRGPSESTLKLKVVRSKEDSSDSESKTVTLELAATRRAVVFKKVSGQVLKTAHGLSVGHISVQDFMSKTTCNEFTELLMKYDQLDGGVIVDLRNNGGGNLKIVNCMLAPFLKYRQLILTEREPSTNKVTNVHLADVAIYNARAPLTVLINQGSASASEIFAGVIQDYKRGLVVGERSFGKGTVQYVREAPEFGDLGKPFSQAQWLDFTCPRGGRTKRWASCPILRRSESPISALKNRSPTVKKTSIATPFRRGPVCKPQRPQPPLASFKPASRQRARPKSSSNDWVTTLYGLL